MTDCEGNALADIAVEVTLDVDLTSGGHLANHPLPSPRPTGRIRDDLPTETGQGVESMTRNSDPDGRIALQFVPPEISGKNAINVTCVDVTCYEPDPFTIEVRVDDISPIPTPNLFFTLVELSGAQQGKNIGDNTRHDGVNHNLKAGSSEVLSRVAFEYAASLFYYPVPEKLHINDASLPSGGLFDISGQWTAPHKAHRRGTNVDIRANQAPGAIPEIFYTQFELAAVYAGAFATFESDHYHLRLGGGQ